jgi:hypothetical protein
VVYIVPIPQSRGLGAEMARYHRCRDRAASWLAARAPSPDVDPRELLKFEEFSSSTSQGYLKVTPGSCPWGSTTLDLDVPAALAAGLLVRKNVSFITKLRGRAQHKLDFLFCKALVLDLSKPAVLHGATLACRFPRATLPSQARAPSGRSCSPKARTVSNAPLPAMPIKKFAAS